MFLATQSRQDFRVSRRDTGLNGAAVMGFPRKREIRVERHEKRAREYVVYISSSKLHIHPADRFTHLSFVARARAPALFLVPGTTNVLHIQISNDLAGMGARVHFSFFSFIRSRVIVDGNVTVFENRTFVVS